jgi:hypothetical protein
VTFARYLCRSFCAKQLADEGKWSFPKREVQLREGFSEERGLIKKEVQLRERFSLQLADEE